MKHQSQPIVTSQSKIVHFGEESGYSTTTSSEEGTLQRGFTTQAYKSGFETEAILKNSKFLKMVSQGAAMEEARSKKSTTRHKRRSKHNYLERPPSPSSQYSSTSSLSQQYGYQDNFSNYAMNDFHLRAPQKQVYPTLTSLNDVTQQRHALLSGSEGNLADRSSMDDMTSSFEDLDVTGDDDVIKTAAFHQFHQSMNEIKSYQTDKTDPQYDMGYYNVGDHSHNPYYDPLDISELHYEQNKKRVIISTSPSSSSGVGSPLKPSPIRGILKNTKGSPQYSTSSTPVRKNSLTNAQQFSKSEENLTSIKRITPPSLPSPLSPGDRKSAFVVVKRRAVNKPTLPDGPAVAVHPPVHQMLNQHGFESHPDQFQFPHSCGKGVKNQTLQMLVTPRNSSIAPPSSTIQYNTITSQLQPPQTSKNVYNEPSSGLPGHHHPHGPPKSGPGGIIYIPAQIDENGIARPVPQNLPRGCHDNSCRISDYHDDSDRHSNSSHGTNLSISKHDSPLPPAETLSNEATRLRHFLENVNPDDLKLRLEKLLDTKDPGSIHALTKLFPGTEFTADAAHCVRCHKDFNPRDPGRCILPHPERMVAKIAQDTMGADFVCGCCNAGFRLIKMDFYEESTNSLLTGHCYSGMHTTDPDSVDYRIDGGSAKSCEEFGCVEFYV
uniref:uncharacterized protein LOC120329588 n=1 Tax=Styela clava TaxID=7725 RepID=UPI0019396669|nr:uncharacterized protein LOC120329588 [Styela clava]